MVDGWSESYQYLDEKFDTNLLKGSLWQNSFENVDVFGYTGERIGIIKVIGDVLLQYFHKAFAQMLFITAYKLVSIARVILQSKLMFFMQINTHTGREEECKVWHHIWKNSIFLSFYCSTQLQYRGLYTTGVIVQIWCQYLHHFSRKWELATILI